MSKNDLYDFVEHRFDRLYGSQTDFIDYIDMLIIAFIDYVDLFKIDFIDTNYQKSK